MTGKEIQLELIGGEFIKEQMPIMKVTNKPTYKIGSNKISKLQFDKIRHLLIVVEYKRFGETIYKLK